MEIKEARWNNWWSLDLARLAQATPFALCSPRLSSMEMQGVVAAPAEPVCKSGKSCVYLYQVYAYKGGRYICPTI